MGFNMSMSYPVVQNTEKDTLLKWVHENPKFNYFMGCDVYAIAYHYIQHLEEQLNYALAQKGQQYGMPEEEAIKFRERKVFSIIEEALEEDLS